MSAHDIHVKRRKTRKVGLIGLLFLAIIVGLWWGLPTYRKLQADFMVEELCKKDGGIRVFEIVRLPQERFSPQGNMVFSGNKNLPPLKEGSTPNDEFYFTHETNWILPDSGFNSLAVWKTHQKLFRAKDGKLLGESIAYSRRGGDPMGPWHPSSFGCPKNVDIVFLVRKVIVKQ